MLSLIRQKHYMVSVAKVSAKQMEALCISSQKLAESNKAVSVKWLMGTRQCNEGRLKIMKCTKPSTKQTNKQSIMTVEQANITEAIVQVATEAVSKQAEQESCNIEGY